MPRDRERTRSRSPLGPDSHGRRNYHRDDPGDRDHYSSRRSRSRSPLSRLPRRSQSRDRERRKRSESPVRRKSRSRSPRRRSRSRSRGRERSRSRSQSPPSKRRRYSGSRSRSRSKSRDRTRHRDKKKRRERSASLSSVSSSDSERRRRRKKDKKRSKSKERERKEKKERKREKKEKKKKAASTGSNWGKYGIISEIDIFTKGPEFHTWLVEERKINPETITKEQNKKEFARFVEDYNTATLPHEKYYNMEAYDRRMSALRAGEFIPPSDDSYDPNADLKALKSVHKKKPVDNDSYLSREQLMELRQVQNERVQAGKMKLLGMDVKQNMGVRMDTAYE